MVAILYITIYTVRGLMRYKRQVLFCSAILLLRVMLGRSW